MRFVQKGSRTFTLWLISESLYIIDTIPGKELLRYSGGFGVHAAQEVGHASLFMIVVRLRCLVPMTAM